MYAFTNTVMTPLAVAWQCAAPYPRDLRVRRRAECSIRWCPRQWLHSHGNEAVMCVSCPSWVLSASTGAYHWPLGSRASRRSGGHPNRRRMPEEILLRRIPPSDLHLILRWRNSFIFNLMESLLGNTQLSHLFLSFLTDLISDSTASASFFRHAVSSGVWPKGLFVSSGTDLAASSLRKDTLPSLMACSITPKFLISICQLGMICCLVDVVACVSWPLFRVGQTEEGQIVLVLGNDEVVHFLCNGTIRVLSPPWLLNLTFNQ